MTDVTTSQLKWHGKCINKSLHSEAVNQTTEWPTDKEQKDKRTISILQNTTQKTKRTPQKISKKLNFALITQINISTADLHYTRENWVVGFMMFNATFNNISVITWRSVLLMGKLEYPEKTTDLPEVTNKLYHIMLCTSPWAGFELTTLVGKIWMNCICLKYMFNTSYLKSTYQYEKKYNLSSVV